MNTLTALYGSSPGATLLLAALLVVGAIALTLAPGWIERGVLRPFWLLPRREYGSLVASAFLHADLPHLAFNAFTFWAFAFPLERTIGTPAFLALYFFGLLVSDLGTWARHRHDPSYRTLGASGAIMAVLFAAIVYAPSSAIFILPIPVPIPAPVFAVCYLAYSYYASRHNHGGVNHDAHLAGALAGVAFVALTDRLALVRALHQIAGRFS